MLMDDDEYRVQKVQLPAIDTFSCHENRSHAYPCTIYSIIIILHVGRGNFPIQFVLAIS